MARLHHDQAQLFVRDPVPRDLRRWLCQFSLNDRHQLPSALLHKPFPEFHAASLLDTERRISKEDCWAATLVNVWATWCLTCRGA